MIAKIFELRALIVNKARASLHFKFFIFLYLFSPTLTSCNSWFSKKNFDQLYRTTPAKPFLWKLNKDRQEIYLFGTIHQGYSPKHVPQIVYDIFDKVPTVIMEVDLQVISASEWEKINFYTDGKRLDQDLSKASFKKLQQYLPHLTYEQLYKMKPTTAYSHLISALTPSATSMDDYIARTTYARGKSLLTLETPLFQSKLLEQIITADKLQLLIETLDVSFIETTKENIYETFYYYKNAEPDQLLKAVRYNTYDDLKLSEEQIDILINQRNLRWFKKIQRFARKGQVFVAVGAAHLGGPKGLLKLFQNENYSVSRIQG